MSSANEPTFPWGGTQLHQISGPGLTKREYFAAMAMHGMLVAGDGEKRSGPVSLAMSAVEQADALLAELEKEHR